MRQVPPLPASAGGRKRGGGRSPRRVRVCDLYTGRSYFSELFSLTDGQRDRAGRVLVMVRRVVELDVGDVGTARACGRSN